MEYTIAALCSLVQKMQGWQETGVVHQYVPNASEFAINAAFDSAGRLYCAYELPGDGIQVKRLRSGRTGIGLDRLLKKRDCVSNPAEGS